LPASPPTREGQFDHQLTDLRARVASIGGTIDREIPENAVSAFKRQRVELPDGTFRLPGGAAGVGEDPDGAAPG
jgi:hypothetical protein